MALHFPDAVIATNTSSLSIAAIGEACGAPERTVGTHYWNPPLLMPLVEVIAGPHSGPEAVELARAAVASCGKRPVLVQRDVPGFIWNRLQYALLREALWIVDNGVAAPEAVDEVVRYGNARRWEHVGPFAGRLRSEASAHLAARGRGALPGALNADEADDLQRARCGPMRRSSQRSHELATPSSRATCARPDARHFPRPATSFRSAGCSRSASASAATSTGRSVSGPRTVRPSAR